MFPFSPACTGSVSRCFLFGWLLSFCALGSAAQAVHEDPSGPAVVRRINIRGNAVTKDFVIYRELLLHAGDTLEPSMKKALLEQSRINLLNTSLFNFVTIEEETGEGNIDILITVVERWYVWPTPILELSDRNFNSWWDFDDYSRVNYGFRVKWSNFRGRMEDLDVLMRFGKNHHYSILYSIPYTDRKKKAGIGIDAGYIRRREVGYITLDDKLRFLFADDFLIRNKYFSLHGSYRRSIHAIHTLQFRYQEVEVSDSLLVNNPNFFYPGYRSGKFLSVYYKFKIDHRDARYYPLKGWYADIEAYKAGLGLAFESPVDAGWLKSTARYFMQLNGRWYTGSSLSMKVSSRGQQPYLMMQALGYERDFVRGYEYYVVDGNHFLLTRNTVKFAVIQERSSTLPLIRTEKFSKIHYAAYLTAFADAGYVWVNGQPVNEVNKLPETLLIGGGVGLDVVTYYDKVMRVEYSVNKSGEYGIFIHFIAGI